MTSVPDRSLGCSGALLCEGFGSRQAVSIDLSGGRIAAVEKAPEGSSLVAMPAFVNAHDHARPLRSSSLGAAGKPLELWLHHLALLPHVDPHLSAVVSLGRSALGGAGVVMVHHTRFRSFETVPDEAAATARAARDIGLRIGFAVAMRDRNPLVYGSSEPVLASLPDTARAEIAARISGVVPAAARQIEIVEAAADAAGAGIDVQYGPTGPQWCSPELLIAVSEASARTGRRVHMHLLETRYQRDWADRAHPDGLVRWLRDIGLLSPRLTLAHCTHARPDELALIAESGATIAVNTSSNLQIRSGIAPLAEMLRRNCRVALGLDGLAFDEDDDALRETRLAYLLHRGWGFEERVSEMDMLAIAIRNGRQAVTGEASGGRIAPGEPADLLLVDTAALDDDALPFRPDPLDLLLARGTKRHVAELIVAGRGVTRDGRLLGVDHEALSRELMDRFRKAVGGDGGLAAALGHLETALRHHFHEPTCC